ncbi:MAG: hypothetical protein ACRDBG_17140, partial [Waterburya sp.]
DASLESEDEKVGSIVQSGVNNQRTYLEGRANQVPEWYKVGGSYYIDYLSGDGRRLIGRFYALPTVVSRFNLESFFGFQIAGYLTVDTSIKTINEYYSIQL